MTSPKTEEVLAWLKREEIEIGRQITLLELQARLATANKRMDISYITHMINMVKYEQSTLERLGVTVHVNPEALYRKVGFGIKGEPGF